MTYDYPTAFAAFGPEEDAAWDRVRASGRYTMGPETEAFEAELAAYHDRAYAIAVNSGSSANLIAATAARYHEYLDDPRHIGPLRMTVGVPALAWATTYSPFWQLGYNFILMDVDDTWNAVVPTIESLEHADWIVGCSVLGNPAHLEDLRQFSDAKGYTLIEDNCEALGARTQDGRLCGTFGHLSTESFFYSHQASGIELGAILTDDPKLNQLCRLLRNHGNAGWGNTNFDLTYDFQVFGFNMRPVELNCAIAREQLRKLPGFIDARRENQAYFRSSCSNLLSVTFPRDTSPYTSPFGIAFRVETPQQRRNLVNNLRATGIDARPPTGGSFTRHKYGEPWRNQPTPNVDLIHDTGLFIGNPPWIAYSVLDRAVKVLRETL